MATRALSSAALTRELHRGLVIPAHPLALTATGAFDERRQRSLTRYYLDAGAGGLAVGVHTTQFAIRECGLLRPVLAAAAEEASACQDRPVVMVAGACGPTEQAVSEAELARELGYDMVLLSQGGLDDYSEDQLLERAGSVSSVLPLFAFYLQPAVGGRVLSVDFWRRLAEMPHAAAIKIAPFNRYQTLDVVRAVCESSRWQEIALYTGNDDNILLDLVSSYRFEVGDEQREKRIVGGLLGHWSFWTASVSKLLRQAQEIVSSKQVPAEWLCLANAVTDANSAVFDAAHGFSGCIPGINEVLRRQGLLASRRCLHEEELSPGQAEEIDRVWRAYPELNDDAFVAENLARWLG